MPCEVCARPCIWRYTGAIYTHKAKVTVCASCIYNGDLADFLDDEFFTLHDVSHEKMRPEFEAELLQRTPGIACFNPFEWPILDEKPLAFLHYGTKEEAHHFDTPRVAEAMKREFSRYGWKEPYPLQYALLFKEVDGDRYRVSIDLE